ncbi:MAG TPA: hypothetical protein VJ623_09025 [Holophagaceae bacterium]|nr:hypothetical protein [Holophagaceae bacterium]
MRRALPVLLMAVPCLRAGAPPQAPPAPAKLDDGLLDPAWFGPDAVLAKGAEADYVWIRPGLRLEGRTVRAGEWADPLMLRPRAEGRDLAAATRLTDLFPPLLRGALKTAFKGRAAVSRAGGDILLVARIVDADAGSTFGGRTVSASGNCDSVTWDLKLLRASDGQVLLAAHHRIVRSGFGAAVISPIEEHFASWADDFARWLAEAALQESGRAGVN